MLVHLERAGLTFTHSEGDQDETADVIEALAGSEVSEEAFVEWVRGRTQEARTEPSP
jgi:prophage maintenance system killer protein